MSTRPPSEQWQSRGPVLTPRLPPPLAPSVAFLPSDEGDGWAVRLGAFTGAVRGERHAAEADRDALIAALSTLPVARRIDHLLANVHHLATLTRYCASRSSALIRVLLWIARGEGGPGVVAGEDGQLLGTTSETEGDAPTLDRVIAGAGCAIVAGEEGDQ